MLRSRAASAWARSPSHSFTVAAASIKPLLTRRSTMAATLLVAMPPHDSISMTNKCFMVLLLLQKEEDSMPARGRDPSWVVSGWITAEWADHHAGQQAFPYNSGILLFSARPQRTGAQESPLLIEKGEGGAKLFQAALTTVSMPSSLAPYLAAKRCTCSAFFVSKAKLPSAGWMASCRSEAIASEGRNAHCSPSSSCQATGRGAR